MKMSKWCIILLLILISQIAVSQNANFEKAAAKEDLVIVNEVNTITISGDRADFMWFLIDKKITIRIQSEEGVEKASNFILPEEFDPSYISHFPKERNYTHVYSKMKIDYFKGTITAKNGDTYDAEIKQDIEDLKMLMNDLEYYGNYKKFKYQITNLKAGDELSVEYGYLIPYDGNFSRLSSFRIFFHDDIFKENYQLNILHDPELMMQYDYLNNADPDTIINTETHINYQWNRENLFGCIDEPGSRPYMSLPHVVFSAKPYDFYYTVSKSFEQRFIPFYTLFAQEREEKHAAITLSVVQGVNTRQYLQIRKFIERQTRGMDDDTLGFEKLKKLHHTIVDEFDFSDDVDYFTREDIRDPKIGDQIGNKTLRDLCRNDLYLTLLLSLNMNYFTTYLCDNRSGVMSEAYFAPMYDNDFLYSAYISDDHFTFLYPKTARFGYYIEEIPFYFENTRARLVHLSDYLKKEHKINEGFRQFILPKSKLSDNIRTSRTAVKINLDELSATFDTQVFLSGQFSTMTRGLYLYDHHHEKVNDLYNRKIWDLNEQIVLVDKEIDVITKEAPFTTRIKAKYKAGNLLTKSENTYSLDLKNCFNHIIYKNFSIENRQMDFYPDFSNRDSYLYYIQFDKNIKLIKSVESIEISNESINMVINIEQMSPNSIKIQSYFAITGKIEINKMEILKEIYNKLEALNKSTLEFSLE